MRSKHALVTALCAGMFLSALGLLAGEAMAAEGVLIGSGRLPAAARTTLVAEIQKARAATPAAFDKLDDLRKQLPEIDAAKRGRLAAMTPALKALGTDALLPMLEELAVESDGRGSLTETAWLAWRVALLEAVGALRDPRSAAVLTAILESPQTELPIVQAAAEALGKLGTDAAAAKLSALAAVAGPKQAGVLAGMGECRRASIAGALAGAIAPLPADGEAAKRILRSLGNVGSAWAWKTPVVAASGEEAATRKAAATALMGAFVASSGDVRRLAADAILVVDDPSTPALIAAARKGASAALHAELDALAARFAQSPIR